MAVTNRRYNPRRRTVWAAITTRNEEDTIGTLIDAIWTLGVGTVLVDEGSVDQTVDQARDAGVDEVIMIPNELIPYGIGACQRVGIRKALAWGAKTVLTIDAGGSHDPADIPALVAALADNDMAIGSRFCPGGVYNVGDGPRWRPWGSRAWATIFNLTVHGAKFHDWSSGFRAFRWPLATHLVKGKYFARNHGWQIEQLVRAVEYNAKIAEVPITYTLGRSSFTAKTANEVFKVWLRTFSHSGGRPR